MALALFDLDNTLIIGNCETDWLHYLINKGYYSNSQFNHQIAEFGRQYETGTGSIDDYIKFVLKPLTQHSIETLQGWREDWFSTCGKAMIAAATQDILERHFGQGDTLVIISASTCFCVQPFAEYLRVDHFLCTHPVIEEGKYTGDFVSPACFAADKITLLEAWRKNTAHSLEGSYFYSDSRNDLPLLEYVDHPATVHADAYLSKLAEQRGWPQLDWR